MTEPAPTSSRRDAHTTLRRAAVAVGACLAIVVSAAVAMGASPSPSSGTADSSVAPAGSARPQASAGTNKAGGSAKPDKGEFKLKLGKGQGFAVGGVGKGRGAGGGVEVTAVNGSKLSLKTVDGWTRTIEATSTTEITKGGKTIAVGAVKAGDKIAFRQHRNDDGTYSITKIVVILPSVGGTVTGKTGSTINVQKRDGTTVVVHVDGSTQFKVKGVDGAASLADVATGMKITAAGEKRSDGSLDALNVAAGNRKDHDNDHDDDQKNASPSPSATTGG
jgi:Domain of unknown function (DUF5666)